MGSLSVGKGGDGQLTSYKVSGMDLRGTQLVVLSACETGLGAAVEDESESVALLRDGGREDHVTSLWEASSVTAQKMMEAYYRKLAEGMGRGDTMQAVQLELLRTEEHHPRDWASFVMVGEWRPRYRRRGCRNPRGLSQSSPRAAAANGQASEEMSNHRAYWCWECWGC